MDITDLSPFGAGIEGVDLARLTPPEMTALVMAIASQGVAVVGGQAHLDNGAFAAFLARIGPPTFTAGETPLPDHPMLNEVSNVGRTRAPRSVFHSDTSYVAVPPAFTALRAVEVPEHGGETVFASGYAAYDRLTANERELLRGARVLHRATGVEDSKETWHPLFRRHPMTDRPALFMSTPERCVDLRLADDRSRPDLIAELFEHYTATDHLFRHRWKPGDVVIWDNRCTLHRGDHSAVSGNRVLHRGMVAGEIPLQAVSV